MTKKPSEKNKSWEKDRRDRLNKAFEELAKLLPQYDPTNVWSKNEIIQKSIAYITDLQQKHEQMLESQDPKALSDYKELVDTIRFFRLRNKQLAELLKTANISIPAVQLPKNLSTLDDDDKLLFKSLPVGRPKKYSNVVRCNGNCNNKTPSSKENKENKNAKKSKKAEITPQKSGESLPISNATTVVATTSAVSTSASVVTTSAVLTTANATITTGILLPLIPCQPLPQSAPTTCPPIHPVTSIAPVPPSPPTQSCNIISIQTLPRLNTLPKRLAKTKAGKVKILPYPVVKLHVRRTDNKVPIPVLKRNVVAVKRKRRRRRKRKLDTKQPPAKRQKTSEITVADSEKKGEEKNDELQTEKKHESPNKDNIQLVVAAKDNQIEQNIPPPLPENDLPDEYFSSIHMNEVNASGSTSVSPTAAFLLSFPVVSASTAGKNACDVEESSDGDPNLKSADNNNLSEGLENLTNFFSTKEYYRFCSSQNASAAEKTVNDKPFGSDGFSGKDIATASLGNSLATSLVVTESSKAAANTQVEIVKTSLNVVASGTISTQLASGGQPVVKDTPLNTTSANQMSVSTVSKTSGYSSNFFVSNIFTTTAPSITVTKENSGYLNYTKSLLDLPKSTSDPLFGSISKTSDSSSIFSSVPNVVPSSTTCVYSSRFNAPLSHPSKLNQIPNPIPAPLPQPTNFPNPPSSYPTFGKFTSDLMSECHFDPNLQATVSKNVSTYGVFSVPSLERTSGSHLVGKITSSTTTTSSVPCFAQQESLLAASSMSTNTSTAPAPATSKTSKKVGPSHVTSKPKNQSAVSVPSSTHVKPSLTVTSATSNMTTSTRIAASFSSQTSYSALAPNFAIDNSYIESYPSFANTSKSHLTATTQAPPINASTKGKQIQHTETTATDKPSSTYPVAYSTTTSSYYYPQIVPPMNTTPFTFSLTSSTGPSIASSQSQPYLPLPNVVQSNDWTAPSTGIDYQTPFTFSLTPGTSTVSQSTKSANSQPYYKLSGKNECSAKNSYKTRTMDQVPRVPITTSTPTTVSSGLMHTTLPLQSAATNFTFSLSKPKITSTTVSAQLTKTLPSPSIPESKYPSYYNAYDFNDYSNSYSKETTNFTFALTKPTDSTPSSSQSTVMKPPQRFIGSFSIDATLGVSNVQNYQKHPQATAQTSNVHQKPTNTPKAVANFEQATPSTVKSQSNYYESNHEKQPKAVQKTHVNWMTSQSSESTTSCRQQQQTSYYPSYVAPSVEYTNKTNYYPSASIEENFPAWSPSKILDTGHLFQSTGVQQPYYNDFNSFVPNNGQDHNKTYSDLPKTCAKTSEPHDKTEKSCQKQASVSGQTNFFSVSQLVDQNFSKPGQTISKRTAAHKTKDSRQKPGSSNKAGGGTAHAKNSNYSAEALISKKEKHRNNPIPPNVQHYHNTDYYPTQGDFLNSYVPQEADNSGNYNSNYFFNYLPSNQNYMHDTTEYPGCSNQQDRSRSKTHSTTNDYKSVDKKHQSTIPSSFSNMLTYESGNYVPPPAVDSYDSVSHYGSTNMQQHTTASWNVPRNNSLGNFTGGQAAIPFVGDDGNMAACVNEPGPGNSGNNLTNFNLSSICPEISGKVDHANNW